MTVEDPIRLAVDPVQAVADLAVGQVLQMLAERAAPSAEHLLNGVAGNAADQQQILVHLTPSPYPPLVLLDLTITTLISTRDDPAHDSVLGLIKHFD